MFDLDGSGKINSLELKTVLGQLAHHQTYDQTQQLKSSMISAAGGAGVNVGGGFGSFIEEASTMSQVDEGTWRRMIQDADLDGDGEISLSEFEKMMTQLLYSNINKQSTITTSTNNTINNNNIVRKSTATQNKLRRLSTTNSKQDSNN